MKEEAYSALKGTPEKVWLCGYALATCENQIDIRKENFMPPGPKCRDKTQEKASGAFAYPNATDIYAVRIRVYIFPRPFDWVTEHLPVARSVTNINSDRR